MNPPCSPAWGEGSGLQTVAANKATFTLGGQAWAQGCSWPLVLRSLSPRATQQHVGGGWWADPQRHLPPSLVHWNRFPDRVYLQPRRQAGAPGWVASLRQGGPWRRLWHGTCPQGAGKWVKSRPVGSGLLVPPSSGTGGSGGPEGLLPSARACPLTPHSFRAPMSSGRGSVPAVTSLPRDTPGRPGVVCALILKAPAHHPTPSAWEGSAPTSGPSSLPMSSCGPWPTVLSAPPMAFQAVVPVWARALASRAAQGCRGPSCCSCTADVRRRSLGLGPGARRCTLVASRLPPYCVRGLALISSQGTQRGPC